MTATTNSTLFSNPYDTVFSILNTRSLIADPRDSTGNRKFIYDTDPFSKAVDFGDYPMIYVELPIMTSTGMSGDGKHRQEAYTQRIFIRTAKEGSGQNRPTDSGVTDMKTIMDSLIKTFKSVTQIAAMNGSNLYNTNINIVNTDSTIISMQDLHEVECELTYGMRFRVSD